MINNLYLHQFIMLSVMNILCALLYKYKIDFVRILFIYELDIKITDNVLFNKWIIQRANKYIVTNTENYNLYKYIQIYFEKFKTKHFND